MVVTQRFYVPLIAVLAGAALVALLIFGVLALGANRTLDQALREGKHPQAPEYRRSLPALFGGAGSLAQYRGRVVLLNFWASWCPPCHHEAPLVESAQRELERDGDTVLGVSSQDTAADSRSFMRQYHLTFPDLRDVSGEFVHAYGTAALPESFLLDPQGRILAISRGEIDSAFVEKALTVAHNA
jgi:cytochrome c biogenesis protein CcmG, thiol:disulfide interchange protein DsbE